MEFPSFNYHNRYVPPPRPNYFFDDDPNLYPDRHHHHRHLPPPHLLPPPPPSYPILPPPPPYPPLPLPPRPPSYNHFTFLDHNRSSPPPPPPPSRVSNYSHRFDYPPDSWSDPRWAPPEPPFRHPILPDEHHRRVYSPKPQSESYYNPRELERVIPSSPYNRDDTIIDGYAWRDISNNLNQDQQVSNDRHGRMVDRHASTYMGKPSSSNSRNLEEDFVEKYDPRYMSKSENERNWDRSDDDPRWVHAAKGEKNEFDQRANDGSVREQWTDYGYESGKFNRVREGREEFKQVQKKSVLLRIGKPNNTHRNRSHDQHKSFLVESNSNFRGKDKDRDRDHTDKDSSSYLDQRMEGDREGSPVDLDVSFKSNALVAKAVVTPSSPVFDNSYTQSRNRKIRKVTEFNSPLAKSTERSTRSGSSPHGSECPSSSEKASKQVRDKESVYDGGNGSLSGPGLDQGGGSGGSNGPKPLSFRLRKKRKVINLSACASSFQLMEEKDDKAIDGENVKKSPPAAPIQVAISFPSLQESNIGEVDESQSAKHIVSDKDGSDTSNPTALNLSMISDGLVDDLNQPRSENEVPLNLESDTQMVSTDGKATTGGSSGVSASSGMEQIEIQKCPEEAYAGDTCYSSCNASVQMQDVSTTVDMNSVDPCINEIVTKFLEDGSLKATQVKEIDSENKQICMDGITGFPEDDLKESPNAAVSSEHNAILSETHSVLNVGATPSSSSLKESSTEEDEVTESGKLIPASVHTPSPDHREPSADDLSKNDLPLSSSIFSASTDGNEVFVTNSSDKSVELESNTKNDDNIPEKSVSKDFKTRIKTSHLEVTDRSANTKTVVSASVGSSVKTQGLNMKTPESSLPMKKPSSSSAAPRVFSGRSSLIFTNSRSNTPSNHITKPRTWHRSTTNSNPPSSVAKSSPIPVLPPLNQAATSRNSYVRSGNTLVRKGAPVSAISNAPPASMSSVKSDPSGLIETRTSAGSGTLVHNTLSRTGGSIAPDVRPKTPPLSGNTKLPDLPSSPPEHPPNEAAALVDGNLVPPKISEDQNGTPSNSDSQKTLDEGTVSKKIQYVKRKSNQLVAASSSNQPVQDLDKTQASSDGYYKRRKNQLIRTSVGDDSINTDAQRAFKINIKRNTGKGISKKYKHLRVSSVWTLNSQSLGKEGVSLRQKLRPHLFPWKRSRFLGNTMGISASIPRNDSSSSISRKLLLSRKRGMIYTKSRHGFSLRMSKLLSLGGPSLKWSKSIERNSKRANQEATLAVAAVEKKKREQQGSACTPAEIKSRNNTSRDRIFRIGLVRYKMDPSRRTLQRISDDEPSTSVQSKEEARRSYVPKRLLIGHDEYVHIGNGNQLVRNPKRRTRIFANEKVRWSLHTARSRLARKRKYCQFFTRFGKCNKDDGKCPYIHDSSKIAVCTKFLNGSCLSSDCKLTHKVIPERMQDCSYFSQGLCSNQHCPYRHVNVNAAAAICEGFLKGYCADGNECRKKHTYACPMFEATGACSLGVKCKLHHPKIRKRKHQNPMEPHQKNARGRYFGSIGAAEAAPVFEKQVLKDEGEDILCQEGKFAEFISLDFSNEEAGDVGSEPRIWVASDPLDLGAVDLDERVKPIGIMNRVAVDGSSVCNVGAS